VGEEEERSILAKRAAQDAAEITQPLLRFWQVVGLDKPVRRIERVSPEVLEHGAVKRIASRTRHDRDLAAWGSAKFWSKRRGLNTKFLHRVD
jgi:hypothetical protein